MSDVFFVIKSFAITIVILVLMQIKIGRATVEQHSLAWLHRSVVVENLQAVAEGAVKATENGYKKVSSMVSGSSKPSDDYRPVGRMHRSSEHSRLPTGVDTAEDEDAPITDSARD